MLKPIPVPMLSWLYLWLFLCVYLTLVLTQLLLSWAVKGCWRTVMLSLTFRGTVIWLADHLKGRGVGWWVLGSEVKQDFINTRWFVNSTVQSTWIPQCCSTAYFSIRLQVCWICYCAVFWSSVPLCNCLFKYWICITLATIKSFI